MSIQTGLSKNEKHGSAPASVALLRRAQVCEALGVTDGYVPVSFQRRFS
jgi:hypothetical protein